MLPGWCCIANRHIGARERRQLIPHVRFQVPFLGPESQLKSGFACAGLLCSCPLVERDCFFEGRGVPLLLTPFLNLVLPGRCWTPGGPSAVYLFLVYCYFLLGSLSDSAVFLFVRFSSVDCLYCVFLVDLFAVYLIICRYHQGYPGQ